MFGYESMSILEVMDNLEQTIREIRDQINYDDNDCYLKHLDEECNKILGIQKTTLQYFQGKQSLQNIVSQTNICPSKRQVMKSFQQSLDKKKKPITERPPENVFAKNFFLDIDNTPVEAEIGGRRVSDVDWDVLETQQSETRTTRLNSASSLKLNQKLAGMKTASVVGFSASGSFFQNADCEADQQFEISGLLNSSDGADQQDQKSYENIPQPALSLSEEQLRAGVNCEIVQKPVLVKDKQELSRLFELRRDTNICKLVANALQQSPRLIKSSFRLFGSSNLALRFGRVHEDKLFDKAAIILIDLSVYNTAAGEVLGLLNGKDLWLVYFFNHLNLIQCLAHLEFHVYGSTPQVLSTKGSVKGQPVQ